jgi:two-component system phosphate regulon sensor histidine kinase PhoR
MREGVLAVGPDGRITAANTALLALAGHEGDAFGRRPAEVLRIPEVLAAVDAALAGRSTSEEIAVAAPRPATLLVGAVPLAERGGALVVLHDLTELQRVERVRRDFVANVSHELRNPVATVQAAAETLDVLLADDPSPDRRRLVETIERSAVRLAALVADLLDLARLDAGQVRVESAPTPLRPLLAAAVAAFGDRAQARGVAIAVRVDPGAERARCDPGALGTVLSNLLDNAVKYTRRGDSIELRARRDGDGVVVEVTDTGPGIEAVHLPRLFERFYRVDAGRSRDVGGTGLGLSIVKNLVLAMRGRIAVRSTPGYGTTFAVTLPAAD